jgi:hypothetical protein
MERRLVAAHVGDQIFGRSRQFVRDTLDGWDCHDAWVVLLADELITNAVQAGASILEVVMKLDGGRLRVEVIDDAPGHPALAPAGTDADDGRGLRVVDRSSDVWGWQRVPLGKATWFETTLA